MKIDPIFKLGITGCLALFVFLFAVASYHTGKAADHIFMDSHTPKAVETALLEVFEGGQLVSTSDMHLEQFLKGGRAAFACDAQALPLMQSEKGICFYPLYTNTVVITVDRSKIRDSIKGWEDLKTLSDSVSLPREEPKVRYMFAALSYAYSGNLKSEAAPEYLAELHKQGRLLWDDTEASIQIVFEDEALRLQEANPQIELIYPSEGSFSVEAGLLTHAPLTEVQAETLADAFIAAGYPPPHNNVAKGSNILSAADCMLELSDYGEVTTQLYRQVLGERRFVPADMREQFLTSLLLVVLLVIWTAQTQKRVVHRGVRRGLYLTGALLIGWVVLFIFKYAIFGYPIIDIGAWYAYYLFELFLPVISLYIAENADKHEDSGTPLWLKITALISCGFFLLVCTNGLHHLVFRFSSYGEKYTYGIGFILLNTWFFLSQFGAFFLLLKKCWDSPKRKTTIFPAAIVLAGLHYSILYSLGFSFWSEISPPLGMSVLVIGFWTAAIITGLIPANRGYHTLFESSSLDMQIFDHNDVLRFCSAGATPIKHMPTKEGVEKTGEILLPEEEVVLWTTPINGGFVVAKEHIHEVLRLQKELERLNLQLELENEVLSQREQVEQELRFVETRNKLTEDVNSVLTAQIRRMIALLPDLSRGEPMRTKALKQITRLSFYCKRRCELFLKEKQEDTYEARELVRLMQEVTAVMGSDFALYASINQRLTVENALLIYEAYHLALDSACSAEIDEFSTRLFVAGNDLCLNLMLDKKENDVWRSWVAFAHGQHKISVSQKDLDGAVSITLRIKGGGMSA